MATTTPRRRAVDKTARATDTAPVSITKPDGIDASGNAIAIVTIERIAEATSQGSFVYLSPEVVEKFGVSVETNPAMMHNDYIAARATGVATEQTTTTTETQETNTVTEQATQTATIVAPTSFEVFADFQMPAGRKPGNGNTKYPFDSLEIGGAFFVPGGTVKTLASTVASANTRYAELLTHPDGSPVMRTNRKQNEVQAVKLTRMFQVRSGKHPKTGVDGAFIGRIALKPE